MKSILNLYDLLPVLLLVLQTLIFLLITIAFLRYLKILQLPYAGMEHSKVVIAAVILLSVMIISFSDVGGVVQAVKTFHNYGEGFYRNLFIKLSQFILIIVLTECLFGLLCFIAIRTLPGFRQSSATEDDMPGAILQAVVILIIAILLYACAKEIIEPITPKYINFN
jgi:hypothetical protein